MKVRLDTDELWPFYEEWKYATEVEIPDEIWLPYKEALDKFWVAYNKLHEYLEKHDIDC